ncbi:MAG: hypothetical protein WCE79_30260 [Xanthobacteraceae bacterium]
MERDSQQGAPQLERRAVILTALAIECRAVLRHIRDRKEEVVRDTVFYRGRFHDWDIAAAEVGAGNPRAAAIAERAIQHFRPSVALFVGVAGGLKDVSLGDVVVATKMYAYEAGKESGRRFNFRPEVHITAHLLEQRARALRQKNAWRSRLDPEIVHKNPQLFVGPMAAGEKVVASSEGHIARFLREHCSDALAVEMEGRGFLDGVQINSSVRGCVIRGISDLLVNKSDADASGYQSIAADAASAVAFEMLADLTGDNQKQDPDATNDGRSLNRSADKSEDSDPAVHILPDLVLLADWLNDRRITQGSSLAMSSAFSGAVEKRIQFRFSLQFKKDVLGYGVDPERLARLIIVEFTNHSVFLRGRTGRDFSPKYFPMRDGLICVLSRSGSIFTFLSFERADIRAEAQDFWEVALIQYIGCRNLKYRASNDEAINLLLTKRHFLETTRRFHALHTAISNYVLALATSSEVEPSGLFTLFEGTWAALQDTLDTLSSSEDDASYDTELSRQLGDLVACLESLLSLAHKMLLIKNITDDARGVIASSRIKANSYMSD